MTICRSNWSLIKKIKHLSLNSALSLTEISEELNCSYTYVCIVLNHKDNYNLVKGLNNENEYFLFTDILEKLIATTPEKLIINGYDFNNNEKVYLKGFGFKF